MCTFIWRRIKNNAHVSSISGYSFYNLYHMVMGEEMSMLMCELDRIHHKGFFCGILKPRDKKQISFMIQMHNEKNVKN